MIKLQKDPERHQVIKLETPLPCGVFNDDATGLCGDLATVAQADRYGLGEWLILPICQRHVEGLQAIYMPNDPQRS